jgi:hypothetical protein
VTRLTRFAPSAALVAAGFVLGVWAASPLRLAPAQVASPADLGREPVDISDAHAERVRQATDALATAQTALEQDGLYRPAIRGVNAYAVLVGGLDAIADLEDGRGVDPITFAGLHAGLATDDVIGEIGYDAQGRLTYKGRLVRMYPPERLRRMNDRHAGVLAVAQGGRRAPVRRQP